MQLSIGLSSCPNDTFMLEALLHKRLAQDEIIWEPFMQDVETLNQWALEGRLDVTKMSFNAWLSVRDHYALLHAGAALGHGCGPLLIARKHLTDAEIVANPVAIPGDLTTANLLFSLRYPTAHWKIPMLFSGIEQAILEGRVTSGVIIHENRFTYAQKGLVRIVDLGEYWEQITQCPIPLGAFAIRRSLGPEIAEKVSTLLRDSVRYAFAHREEVMPWVRKYAQEMDDAVMTAHIDTYVNDYSIDLGEEGFRAVELLRKKAAERLIP